MKKKLQLSVRAVVFVVLIQLLLKHEFYAPARPQKEADPETADRPFGPKIVSEEAEKRSPHGEIISSLNAEDSEERFPGEKKPKKDQFPLTTDLEVAKTGGGSKLGCHLLDVCKQLQANAENNGKHVSIPDFACRSVNEVGIQVAGEDPERLRKSLKHYGFRELRSTSNVLAGWLPVANLTELEHVDGLRFARLAVRTRTAAANVSGDIAVGADILREEKGVTGSGVKVGVISDSFNAFSGAEFDKDAGDLPEDVHVLQDDGYGGDEGRAMAQIVHRIAPGADLYFHSAFNSPGVIDQTIAEAYDALFQAGCRVITDDVGMITAPYFQNGFAAAQVNAIADAGVLCFSSAGNAGRSAIAFPFSDSGETFMEIKISSTTEEMQSVYLGNIHNFENADAPVLTRRVLLPSGASVRMVLQWDEPYYSITPQTGGSASDVDLYILDSEGHLQARSISYNVGADPYEFVSISNYSGSSEYYNICISLYEGPAPSLLKLILFGSASFPDAKDTGGTIFAHPNTTGMFTLGAARSSLTPAYGVEPAVAEYFASAGGIPVLFDDVGKRLDKPIVLNKPDATAPDGVKTLVHDQSGELMSNWMRFYGTSAAAPQAAGAAALLLESAPNMPAEEIKNALRKSALDMDDASTPDFDYGFDFHTGAGLISVPAAAECIDSTTNTSVYIIDTSVSMQRFFGDSNRDLQIGQDDDINSDGENNLLDAALYSVFQDINNNAASRNIRIFAAAEMITDLSSDGFEANTSLLKTRSAESTESNNESASNFDFLKAVNDVCELVPPPRLITVVTSGYDLKARTDEAAILLSNPEVSVRLVGPQQDAHVEMLQSAGYERPGLFNFFNSPEKPWLEAGNDRKLPIGAHVQLSAVPAGPFMKSLSTAQWTVGESLYSGNSLAYIAEKSGIFTVTCRMETSDPRFPLLTDSFVIEVTPGVGWHTFSIPSSSSVSLSEVGMTGTVFFYNTQQNQYQTATELQPGVFYWLYAENPPELSSFSHSSTTKAAVSLGRGWNAMALPFNNRVVWGSGTEFEYAEEVLSYNEAVMRSILVPNLWEWQAEKGTYNQLNSGDFLNPGSGYWIYLQTDKVRLILEPSNL